MCNKLFSEYLMQGTINSSTLSPLLLVRWLCIVRMEPQLQASSFGDIIFIYTDSGDYQLKGHGLARQLTLQAAIYQCNPYNSIEGGLLYCLVTITKNLATDRQTSVLL